MESSGQKISAKAIELGFKLCGFARAEPLDKDREFFITYLKERRACWSAVPGEKT